MESSDSFSDTRDSVFHVQGGGLSLRTMEEHDAEKMVGWRNSSAYLSNCTYRGTVGSTDDYLEELSLAFDTDLFHQFIIQDASDTPVGTIFAYQLNHHDGYGFISTFVSEKSSGKGLGIKAFVLLSHFLFEVEGLYKVYMDVYDYNTHMINILGKTTLSIEGRFKNQRLFCGKRYDVLRFAFYQDDLERWIRKFRLSPSISILD